MASPSDIPKIQSNLNLNQPVATESSKIDKDRKENPHEQTDSDHPKEEAEKDSVELSQQAKAKLENQNPPPSEKSNDEFEDNEDEPGRNIDFKA
tara:strand:+ start:51 stop:332 length:282 start_codon:yes stop_codon:yes gene_type:complete